MSRKTAIVGLMAGAFVLMFVAGVRIVVAAPSFGIPRSIAQIVVLVTLGMMTHAALFYLMPKKRRSDPAGADFSEIAAAVRSSSISRYRLSHWFFSALFIVLPAIQTWYVIWIQPDPINLPSLTVLSIIGLGGALVAVGRQIVMGRVVVGKSHKKMQLLDYVLAASILTVIIYGVSEGHPLALFFAFLLLDLMLLSILLWLARPITPIRAD